MTSLSIHTLFLLLFALCLQGQIAECIRIRPVASLSTHANFFRSRPVYAASLKQSEDKKRNKISPTITTALSGSTRTNADNGISSEDDEEAEHDDEDVSCSLLRYAHAATKKKQPSDVVVKNDSTPVLIEEPLTFKLVCSRLPEALWDATFDGAFSFVESLTTMVPVALVLNVKFIREPKVWASKGFFTGMTWAKLGAFYAAGESLSAKIRGKEDR
jgi:hypothetical protein